MATNNALNNSSTSGFSVTGGVLSLPTTTSTVGQLTINSNRFLHSYGTANTFLGESAGNFTLTGTGNTALGYQSFINATSGSDNVAVGQLCMSNTVSGTFNVGVGRLALEKVTSGTGNVGIGTAAGKSITTSSTNVAIGLGAMENGTGSANICIGQDAMQLAGAADSNIGIGYQSLRSIGTGTLNVSIGYGAGNALTTTDSHNILINNAGVVGDNNTLRVGSGTGTGSQQLNASFIHGIRGITTVNNDAIAVLIDSVGQLGTVSSSIRYKQNVVDMGDVSSSVLQLRPVTFDFIGKPSHKKQVGLIAEEVEQVMPNLVAYNKDGEVESVKYHDLPVLLLNELQKALKRIELLEEKLAQK